MQRERAYQVDDNPPVSWEEFREANKDDEDALIHVASMSIGEVLRPNLGAGGTVVIKCLLAGSVFFNSVSIYLDPPGLVCVRFKWDTFEAPTEDFIQTKLLARAKDIVRVTYPNITITHVTGINTLSRVRKVFYSFTYTPAK